MDSLMQVCGTRMEGGEDVVLQKQPPTPFDIKYQQQQEEEEKIRGEDTIR